MTEVWLSEYEVARLIRAEVERWSFPAPGYRLEWVDLDDGNPLIVPPDHAQLRVHVTTRDSRRPDLPETVVTHYFPLPLLGCILQRHGPDRFREYFGRWLHGCILRTVTHEADEWLRRGNELPFDPHRAP